MLSNCKSCQYYTRPLHYGDISCVVNLHQRYALMWESLQTLPKEAIECFPIDDCRDFAPRSIEPEITVTISDSEAIAQLRYIPATEALFIQFTSGETEYEFTGVPQIVFEEFCEAPSKGRFYHSGIRNQYQTA